MALQFETKYSPKSTKDVLVTLSNSNKNNGKEQDVLRVRFTNEMHKMIGDTDCMVMAATDTRLYFAPADSITGWKLRTIKNSSKAASISCKSPALIGWAIHGGVGEYDLQFDQKEHLYFIEKEVLKFQQRLR